MATAKKPAPKAKTTSGGLGLMAALDNIMSDVKLKESRTYRPVPTGINVLDFYNARYFMNHETKEYELFTGMPMGKVILKIGYTGTGKSCPVDQVVQTLEGERRIGDLAVGDTVVAQNGCATTVSGVFFQGVIDTYRMTFYDGTSTLCGLDHIWTVCQDSDPDVWKNLTTAELMQNSLYGDFTFFKYCIPMCEPVQYSEHDYSLSPYMIGLIAATGGVTDEPVPLINEIKLTTLLESIDCNARLTMPSGHVIQLDSNGSDFIQDFHEAVKATCGTLDSSNWDIPRHYLYGSVAQRIELLRGMMDTASIREYSPSGVTIYLANDALIESATRLVQSLGGTARRVTNREILIAVSFNPFHDISKANAWRTTPSRPIRQIESITHAGQDEHVCIMVDNDRHLFLINDFIVTHNTTLCVQEALALVEPYASGTVFHFDLENAWSKERTADITGLSMDVVDRKYKRFDPVPLEVIYAFVKKIINTKQEMMTDPKSEIWVDDVRTGERVPTPTVIIIDTVAALQSTQVMDEKEEMGSLLFESGAQAKANNAFVQRLAGMIGDPNITIYAVNHIRVDPGPSGGPPKAKRIQYLNQDETCPGGTGFPQYADYFLKMVPSQSLTNQRDEGFKIPGKVVRCTIAKSRLSYDGRQFELVLTDNGFSNAWSNLHFLKSVKALKGAGAHLFLEAADGRVTQKFAQAAWESLYEGDPVFREIADAVLEVELLNLVPQPGSTPPAVLAEDESEDAA